MQSASYAITAIGYTGAVTEIGELIGASIRARRKPLMTQNVFGEKLGVSQALVSQWERGETIPNGEQLVNIAVALGCSVETLLSGVSPAYDKLASDLIRQSGTENGSTAHGSHSPGVSDANTATRLLVKKITRDYQSFADDVSKIAESLTKLVSAQPDRIRTRPVRKRGPDRGGRR